MSRTLFWYLFKDLFRVFAMTSGVLAGIMSFAGLLRPLTENGLNAYQVSRMLTFFMPAMTTYSLPIAALFATTVVYGRLSADNELTACRASGISHISIAMPALLLGLVVAILSLLLLCFTVPIFTLKVEKVIYSNLAQLVANKIERTHQIRFPSRDPVTVFAQDAAVHTGKGEENVVSLRSPMIVRYERTSRSSGQPLIPREFWMASSADAYIQQDPITQQSNLSVVLRDGVRIPREVRGGFQGGLEATQFGPLTLPSPLEENTKFMDIAQLRRYYRFPGESRRVRSVVNDLVLNEQHTLFIQNVKNHLDSPAAAHTFTTAGVPPEVFVVGPGGGKPQWRAEDLIVPAADQKNPGLQFLHTRAGQKVLSAVAHEIRIHSNPDPVNNRFSVTVEMADAVVSIGQESVPRALFARSFTVPMSEQVLRVRDRTAEDYLAAPDLAASAREQLQRQMILMGNKVRSEMHSRSSFAVSCLILVMVGCALGMMFRSGDFLSAFAVSFVPALLSITLIVAGQQTCDHVPYILKNFHNPLSMGLALIWVGNLVNLIIAVILLGRLQRQ